MPESKAQLDPWRVICGCLFDVLRSYAIPSIIDKTGLTVDWSVTNDYSDNTRKAEWRPRVHAAYEALSDDDKLRVAFIAGSELLARPSTETQLFERLAQIGWGFDNGHLVPLEQEVTELFFPRQTQHDAYAELKKIFARATHSLSVVDPYLDGSIFILLSTLPGNAISISLLTHNVPSDFTQEAKKFCYQYPHLRLEVRRSAEFHDRFIILDGADCWHVGCSIKDAGNKAFMLSRIQDETNRNALVQQQQSSWTLATPVPL